MPSFLQEEINNMYTTSIPYQRLMKTFVDKVIPGTRRKPIFNRYSRRYPMKIPAYKVEHQPKILVAIDTSGSMSVEDLGIAIGDLKRMYKMGYEFDVAETDAVVHRVYHIKDYDGTVMGRGGTDFSGIFELANIKEYSGVMIITDGYVSVNFEYNKPLIWIITPGGSTSNKKGMVVRIGEDYQVNGLLA